MDNIKKNITFISDAFGKAKEYQKISDYYIEQEQYDSAIIYLSNTLSYCNTQASLKIKASSNCNLGVVYKELGFFDKSLKHYIDALTFFENQNDIKKIASIKINIGQLFNTMGKPQKALIITREAIQFLTKNNQDTTKNETLAFAFNNLGIAFQNTQQSDSALNYYLRSLAIKLKLGKILSASYTLNNIGTLYIDTDFDKALDYFFKSLTLKRKLNNATGLVNCFTNIGQLYEKKGELEKSLKYQDSAMYLMSKINNPDLKTTILFNLSSVYEKKKDHARALKYLTEYILLKDSIKSLAIEQKLTSLQIIYETEKKEREIQLSKANINILEKEIIIKNNRVLILFSIAFGLVLLVVLLIISIRFKQKKFKHKEAILFKEKQIKNIENEKLKKEVEHKNRELSLLTLHSLHKKELMMQLKDKLETNELKKNEDSQTKKLNHLIENILNFEDDWKVFKDHFEAANVNFFKNLESLSADLTQTDLRHCAYIKIGLTTKEIAELLNITPESVQKSRVRLKKKMGLDREIDLKSYIKNIS